MTSMYFKDLQLLLGVKDTGQNTIECCFTNLLFSLLFLFFFNLSEECTNARYKLTPKG